MQKLTGETMNITEDNIQKLAQLFPEVISEGKIDFEKLQLVLGEDIEQDKERYSFNWHGKAETLRLSQTPSMGTLRPCQEESKDWDTTQNMYIEGDNLEVLKLLQKSYYEKVKMIYIDPPYNTGKDFVYKDNFKDTLNNYKEITGQVDSEGNNLTTNFERSKNSSSSINFESNGRYHSDWLNMMYPRLRLARNLLTQDGVIFISMDDNEVANLRKICDEVFGEDNFVGQWNWFKSATPPNLSKKIKKNIEYILCYQKSKNNISFSGITKISSSDDPFTKPQNSIKNLTFPIGSIYTKLNDGTYPKGIYGTSKFPNEMLNDLIVVNGVNQNAVTFKNRFIWVQKKLNEEISNNTKVSLSTNLVLSYKKANYGAEVPPNFINDKVRVLTTENAGKSLYNLFDSKKIFDYPKPVSLLEYLINFNIGKSDIILDFFSGSATTAHAVMKMNAEDGGNRRFIMVQLPEKTDEKSEAYKAGYPNICEIGKERIHRAGDKILEDNQASKEPKKLSLLDTGFKVFKLDDSNLKKWHVTNKMDIQQELFDAQQNIVEGRSKEDLLYEVILKMGLDLTYPIEVHEINGNIIYTIGFGALMICLDDNIAPPVAGLMAQLYKTQKPETWKVVFLDNGFTDVDKTNSKEILKTAGLEEDNFVTV